MATNTTNYDFKKPDESDFYDVADQNKNWDLADEALKNLDTPTFEDYTGSTAVPSATDAIDQIKSKGKLGTLLSNIKAAFKGACLIGHIVNNCVTDNVELPLSAAQGKVLKDLYTQLYSEMGTITNGIFISNQSLDIITKTGNYCGANISELVPYITPSSWCGIKAYVQSDNAAFFHIITNNNIVINAYRDGDGTYKFYPLALKSDLDPLFTSRGTLTISADDAGIGCWRINSVNPVNGISDGILLCFSTFNTDFKVNLQFLYGSDNSRGKMYMRVCWYGAWRDWVSTAVS